MNTMKFNVELTHSAERDLAYYTKYEQRVIVKSILKYLQVNANIQTRRRKQLRPNPLAPWELRIGDYRAFYEIEKGHEVNVIAIGHKEHHDLFIRGEEVDL